MKSSDWNCLPCLFETHRLSPGNVAFGQCPSRLQCGVTRARLVRLKGGYVFEEGDTSHGQMHNSVDGAHESAENKYQFFWCL